MKPIKVKSDDGTFTIVSVHAPKGEPGGGIYLLQVDGQARRYTSLSPAGATRLRDALTVAIEAAKGA